MLLIEIFLSRVNHRNVGSAIRAKFDPKIICFAKNTFREKRRRRRRRRQPFLVRDLKRAEIRKERKMRTMEHEKAF